MSCIYRTERGLSYFASFCQHKQDIEITHSSRHNYLSLLFWFIRDCVTVNFTALGSPPAKARQGERDQGVGGFTTCNFIAHRHYFQLQSSCMAGKQSGIKYDTQSLFPLPLSPSISLSRSPFWARENLSLGSSSCAFVANLGRCNAWSSQCSGRHTVSAKERKGEKSLVCAPQSNPERHIVSHRLFYNYVGLHRILKWDSTLNSTPYSVSKECSELWGPLPPSFTMQTAV